MAEAMPLVDDPSVLEAALALVDQWYEAADQTDSDGSSSPSSVASSKPRQKRSREELTALRASVQQLQHVIARHWPKQRIDQKQASSAATTSDAALLTRRVQARRVLYAVHSYNRLQAATRLTLSVVETVKLRPFDNERMVGTLRSRLDALTLIARANSLKGLTATNGPVHELSNSPTLTGVGLQIQAGFGRYLPFKLSLVEEAFWEQILGTTYGDDEELGKQLAVKLQDEILAFVARSNKTPLGEISASGPSALRRVYEDDGSVLYVYTSLKTAPPPKHGAKNSEFENLFAGFTIKQAGWTRIRRVQQSDGFVHDKPLVYMESNMSLMMEAKPGWMVPTERLMRIWDAIVMVSSQQSRSREALENRLMDLSLARQKKEQVESQG